MRPQPASDPAPRGDARAWGCVVYLLGLSVGGLLLLGLFLLPPLMSARGDQQLEAMALGAVLALPTLAFYLWVPWVVDRYDPEPAWALFGCLVWGAIAACGFAAVINTSVDAAFAGAADAQTGKFFAACVSAPLFEELFKGLAVAGMYWFVRREFDGVVDGVMYACFAALGFAAVENVIYYSNAAQQGAVAGTFLLRGILAPWGHPLYTSMTGIGFGIARETDRPWVRFFAPLFGYATAVFLHFVWNFSASVSGELFVVMMPLWLLVVTGFFLLVLWLVSRKGRIIRLNLQDEVLLGHLTAFELELVCSPFASWRATSGYGGAAGRRFVDAAARLALSKWHSARAVRSRNATISMDYIVPLRRQLKELREQVERSLGRPLPRPQPIGLGQPAPPLLKERPSWWIQPR
jgi:RsiW-degrading membrane proteinase PrsW (M82 family)